jgi:hypothetical protein
MPIDYSQEAITKFGALMGSYAAPLVEHDPRSYWKFANSFDTMLDFLIFVKHDDAPEVAKMVNTQYAASLKAIKGYHNAWFDDLGWWTIAANRAEEQDFFPDIQTFSEIVTNCWSRFTGNAPFVWERHAQGTFPNCQPAVDHGVWNGYWAGTDEKWKGPKSGDPTNPGLEGIQNTVTNCVYLIAAQRLAAKDPKDPNPKVAATNEYTFLSTWFSEQPNPLWWPGSFEGRSLVRERVSHFSNGDETPDFQLNWAWTGDQGLMLGALVDRIRLMGVSPTEGADLLERATQIVLGVEDGLADPDNLLLRSYTTTGSPPDSENYDTGKGVFWRYLLHAWVFNSDLQTVINQQDYKDFLTANADDAANRPSTGQTFDQLTNDLSVLVAASYILK